MKIIKRIARLFRRILFVCIFVVCVLLGIVPVMPKGKKEPTTEINGESEKEEKEESRHRLPAKK